jgi:nitrogen fixation/metabolism regulation signal transduction histidine kinase
MPAPTQGNHKRSWRNYLLDSRYQLRFTLIMVVLAALLLGGLGFWVMRAAASTTGIAIDQLDPSSAQYAAKVDALHDQERVILLALIGVGLLLMVGLFVYGIIMTHKVAGPLHKIGQYLDKVKDGTYATVYGLRRGDRLVHFYDHFRAAHESLRQHQLDDVLVLRALLAAADAHPQVKDDQALAAALLEAREVLARKEAGLG